MKIERTLFSCLSTIKDPCCRTGCLCSPHLNSFLKFYVNQWFFSNQWLKVVVSFLAWAGASLSFCVKTVTTVLSFMKIFIQIRNLKMKRTLIVLQDFNPSPFMQVCFLFQRLWLTVLFYISTYLSTWIGFQLKAKRIPEKPCFLIVSIINLYFGSKLPPLL